MVMVRAPGFVTRGMRRGRQFFRAPRLVGVAGVLPVGTLDVTGWQVRVARELVAELLGPVRSLDHGRVGRLRSQRMPPRSWSPAR